MSMSSEIPGENVVSRVYAGPPELRNTLPARTPVEAARQAQHILATVASDVVNAEGAVARARDRGANVPTSLGNTATWVRSRMESLRAFVESHPADLHMTEIQVRANEISESASALRVLAERTNLR